MTYRELKELDNGVLIFHHFFHNSSGEHDVKRGAALEPMSREHYVTLDSGFDEVASAFHQHAGRSTLIVDSDGRLLGVLLRKDFMGAFHQGSPS